MALLGLYDHVCKREALREAYRLAKRNNGSPGIDGVTLEVIEAEGLEGFLDQLREEVVQRSYRPLRARKVEIPKDLPCQACGAPLLPSPIWISFSIR